MKLLKELSRKEFRSKFGTKELCLSFHSDIKWADGYQCFKCNNMKCSGSMQKVVGVVYFDIFVIL